MRAVAIGFIMVLTLGLFGWSVGSREGPVAPEPPSRMAEPQSAIHDVAATRTGSSTARMTAPIQASTASPARAEPVWKRARATVFWVGEGEGAENGFIHNRSSAWDVNWQVSYGGYDDPECRNGSYPCGFTPKENPFYVALPYNDLRLDGYHKDDARLPPGPRIRYESDLKDRWIAIRANGETCFAQWEDVGPFGEDDIEYVFGDAAIPLNSRGERAGIDLSPAVRDCLGVSGLSDVEWRHAAQSEIPKGPWTRLITE